MSPRHFQRIASLRFQRRTVHKMDFAPINTLGFIMQS